MSPAAQTLAPAPQLPAAQVHERGPAAKPLGAATGIVIIRPDASSDAAALADTAALLAADLVADGHLRTAPKIAIGTTIGPHDIALAIGAVDGSDHPEAYSLTANKSIRIVGTSPAGVFYGSRTLLQLLRQGTPSGTIRDWPTLDERSLMVDIGRKYFSPDWLKDRIREMSYLKLNTLQLHVSEGLGFRIECRSHPEIVSPQFISQDELRDVIAFARRHYVTVIGDVDSPAHLEHILAQHPQFQLVLANGQVKANALDFSNAQARALIGDIVGEMADLFGGPVFHLGGDEFFPAPWEEGGATTITAASAPQLVAWGREELGDPEATIFDAYEHYLNGLAALVRSKGSTPRMFNDDIYPGEGRHRIDPDVQADVWIRWRTNKPNAADYVRAGHQVINANGDYLYFILTGDGVGTGPNKHPTGIYERWTPRTFMGAAGSAGDFMLPDELPMLGAHLSIWCDTPGALTQEQVAAQLQPWLQAFAQQTWGSPQPVPTFAQLQTAVIAKIGNAPTP